MGQWKKMGTAIGMIGLLAGTAIIASGCDLLFGSGSRRRASDEGAEAADPEAGPAGGSVADPGSWPFFRGNSRGVGSKTEVDTSANQGNIRWTAQISDLDSPTLAVQNFVSGEALLGDGSLLVASSDPGNTNGAELTKLDTEGNVLWRWPKDSGGNIAGAIRGTPVVDTTGTAYVGSEDGFLYAVDLNGNQEWRIDLGAEISAPAAIGGDGTIYVGTAVAPTALHAVNPDGTEKWSYPTGDIIRASVNFAADGTIYVRVYDGGLIALNPDGTKKWEFDDGVGGSGSTPVVAADGTVYFGDFASATAATFYALNADGTLKWSVPVSGGLGATPVVGLDGTVYLGTWNNRVHAFNPDGSEKWTSGNLANAIQASLALGRDGTVYAATRDSTLFALDTDDGGQRWSVRIRPGCIVTAPLTIGDDGTVYVHGSDGVLYALKD